jgi:hypothetical protein
MTHFLRFPDKQAWTDAATEAGFLIDDTLIAYTHDRAIDVVGQIPDVDGWHVNFAGMLPDGWDEFLVTPNDPYRVFA